MARSRAAATARAPPVGMSRPISRRRRPQVPDPALVDVPAELRAEIEEAMARYPDRHSAALPALRAAQDHHGWCSPQAILEAACVMRVTPGYLTSVAPSTTCSSSSRWASTPSTSARTSPARCAAPTSSMTRSRPRSATNSDITLRHFECLGACDIAPMVSVDHAYYGPLGKGDAERLVGDLRAGTRADPQARPVAARRPPRPRSQRRRSDRAHCCCERHRRAGARTTSPSTSGAAATRRCARRSR